jgi:hypothetical protein
MYLVNINPLSVRPVLIKNAVSSWPAIQLWQDNKFLRYSIFSTFFLKHFTKQIFHILMFHVHGSFFIERLGGGGGKALLDSGTHNS